MTRFLMRVRLGVFLLRGSRVFLPVPMCRQWPAAKISYVSTVDTSLRRWLCRGAACAKRPRNSHRATAPRLH